MALFRDDAEMAMAKTAMRTLELEPIDRLEEKLKRLVAMVERMKAEQARAADENVRLSRELESMRQRIAASEAMSTELTALKEERDIIKTRVGEMLEQLEALNV
jgi:regulator of replication initiation timing